MKSWPYRMSSKLKKSEKWVVNVELTNNTFFARLGMGEHNRVLSDGVLRGHRVTCLDRHLGAKRVFSELCLAYRPSIRCLIVSGRFS